MDKDYLVLIGKGITKTMLDVREISHISSTSMICASKFTYTISMKNGDKIEADDDLLNILKDQERKIKFSDRFKQEIIKAYNEGWSDCENKGMDDFSAEKYYNENFPSNK
ncbi:hypothetical protein [Chryseobacterium sp.]|uniref:hypothetical protein n=1 Tax=Chryseobacterium sp. TaxID=1871047 RepID=UPI0024E2668E|nr:hypothetical protein [Chryseobacterium sp.]